MFCLFFLKTGLQLNHLFLLEGNETKKKILKWKYFSSGQLKMPSNTSYKKYFELVELIVCNKKLVSGNFLKTV